MISSTLVGYILPVQDTNRHDQDVYILVAAENRRGLAYADEATVAAICQDGHGEKLTDGSFVLTAAGWDYADEIGIQ